MSRKTVCRWLIVLVVAVGLAAALSASPAWAQEGAAPAPAPAAPKAHAMNYFQHYFVNGGWIVWFIELPLSMVVVALAVMFLTRIRRANLVPQAELQRFVQLLEAKQYRTAIDEAAAGQSLLSYAMHKALSSASMGYLMMEQALEDAVDEQAAILASKIEPLNIIGNVGPLIGLFGTVIGMIETFTVIVAQGGVPNASDLANGISIALVCTAWGLMIAIPGLAVYGALRNRIDIYSNEAALRGQEILNLVRAGTNRPAPAGPGPAAPPAPALPTSRA